MHNSSLRNGFSLLDSNNDRPAAQLPHTIAPERAETRLIQFELMRATEMAALNCLQWLGKGEKESADEAACDAIRGMFDAMDMRGEVVIGEGVKDKAPGLFAGERVGAWRDRAPRVDIAIDPLDGTTNVSKGLPNAISCIAAAVRHDEATPALQYVPAFYMKKLAYPPAVRRAWIKDDTLPLDINAPLKEVIALTAKILGKNVRDVVVMALDRPRNEAIIEEVRRTGASLRMIADGDISAALGPAMPKSGVDLYAGVGGAPEGILAAVGLRCMGGGMQAQMWPRDEAELASLAECGWGDHVERVYRSRDLVSGDDIFFIATGICDSPLLRGAQVQGSTVTTQSVVMRLQSGTVRYIETEHDLTQRPLRLRSRRPNSQNNADPAAASMTDDSPRVGGWRELKESEEVAKLPGILLIGPPGCGKGTIGKALGSLPGFIHCSSGDVIRAAMSEKGARGERWAPVVNGGLISDDDMWELFDHYIDAEVRPKLSAPLPTLLVVDGVPRCPSQVPELRKRIQVRGVFYLAIENREVLLQRLLRRSHSESREDDASRQIMLTRMRLFEEQTLPLLDEYPNHMLHVIDAEQAPTAVLSNVLERLSRSDLRARSSQRSATHV
jgi:fructose-1,6-bisphosphatase II